MRNKPERMIGMKKFKKVIAMCLTAAMALSMMSIGAFAAEEEMITEKVNTYVENENGVLEVVSIDVSVPKNADVRDKNDAYLKAAYYAAFGEEMPEYNAAISLDDPAIATASTLLPIENFNVGVNQSNAGGTNGTIINTYKGGLSGFGILINNFSNLTSYNLSFENGTNGDTWYDTGLQLNQGRTVLFVNGKRSNASGEQFIYTPNVWYTIRVSGQKADLYSNATMSGTVYAYNN